MAGELTTKIRLVRCPKCKKVLPELPNFNVYKCGGCGATLQAKHRVDVVRSAEPEINTEEAVLENQTNKVHEEKEEPSLQKKGVVVPCSEECSSCQNDESDQSKSGDGDAEQPSGVVQLAREAQNDENYRSDSMDSENDGSQVFNEVFSPTEYIDDKDNRFVANGNVEHANSGDESFANREFSRDGNEAAVNEVEERSSDRENEGCDVRGDEDFSHPEFEELTHNEIERFARYENEESSQEFVPGGFAQNENEDSSREFGHTDDDDDFSRDSGKAENEDSSREFIRNDNEDSSQEFGEDKIAEIAHTANGSLSFSRENLESTVNEEGSSSAKANSYATINEKSESDSRVRSFNTLGESSASGNSPVTESLKSPRSALKQPQNRSPGAYGRLRSVEFVPSSELRGNPREASKSPTRSPHTYYGSDDQIPHKQLRLFEDDQSRTSFTRSQELTGRDEFMAQAMMNRDTDRDGFLVPPRHRNSRPERHDLPSSSAFQRHSSFQSDLSEDPEQMMKVLKMVLEIQNQSRKSGSLYDPVNDRASEVSPSPRYDSPREVHLRHPNDPRYLARYASGSNYAAERHRPKKIPFSGDPTGTGHQLDPSCSHCFPREWSRSAQLPPPMRYNAFPPSPQWSTNSELPRRSQELLMNHRQPRRTARRHFLPVAQAAPFIACYKCCTVLHLPAEFLLCGKKCHRLKCGACSAVLEFSLENGSRIVRSKETRRVPVPVAETPPVDPTPRPSPAEDSRREAEPRKAEASDDRPIEEDPDSGPPVPTPLGRAFDRIIFGVLNAVDDGSRELGPEPSRGRYNDRPPRHEPSKKPEAAEKEEDNIGRSTSPLHRLMGYSSPSQVIYGSRPYGLGASGSSHSTRRGNKF